MPKVSIIIPVYNVEKYLKKCMDSVLDQTLRDIEVICIDDGSNDRSYTILQDYAKKDNRITLLKNDKNFGQSYARNRGVDLARGEYVQFVDSDDSISVDTLEVLYDIAKKNNLDLLRFSCEMEGLISQSMKEYEHGIVNRIYDGCLLLGKLVKKEILFFPTGIHFVKLEILKKWNIYFYCGIIHEDVLFNYELFVRSRRCMCINEKKYMYNRRENSTTISADCVKSLYGYLVCIHSILNKQTHYSKASVFLYATCGFLGHYQKEAERVLYKIDRRISFAGWNNEIVELYNILFNKYINYNLILEKLEYIKSFSVIYIYGAGVAAEQMFKILNAKDIKITGVLVSSATENKKNIYGHRIAIADEFDGEIASALILICVTEKYRNNIIETLDGRGFNNVLFVGR